MRGWMWAALTAAVIAGCAEGGTGNATTGTGGTTSGSSSSGGGAGGGSASSSSSSSSGSSSSGSSSSSGGAAEHVVLNEISAKGEDWVEIANPTGSDVDLGGYGLCDDVDPTKGSECDMDTIVRFPDGTMIPAGGYVLIVGNQDPADGVGPHVMCLTSGGPTTCFYASWKVSASNGETIHLLDDKDDVVDEQQYPTSGVADGQTWGRLPDGTGSFAAAAPTPGEANAAP